MTIPLAGALAQRLIVPGSVNAPRDEKPQISTDGWPSYRSAILDSFGSYIKYGQLVKSYGESQQEGRYGPPGLVDTDRRRVQGIEDLATICSSHVDRNNLTIRTFMKRFTRLSHGFSKTLENLAAAIAIHVAYFNFCWRPRKNKGGRYRLTPTMQAGVTHELWDMDRLYDEVMGA